MGLLALGVVAGYGSGFAHLCAWHRHHDAYRQQLMHEFAQHCVDATRTAPSAQPGGAQVVQGAPQPAGAVTVVVNPTR
jgi:hypothetical protein